MEGSPSFAQEPVPVEEMTPYQAVERMHELFSGVGYHRLKEVLTNEGLDAFFAEMGITQEYADQLIAAMAVSQE